VTDEALHLVRSGCPNCRFEMSGLVPDERSPFAIAVQLCDVHAELADRVGAHPADPSTDLLATARERIEALRGGPAELDAVRQAHKEAGTDGAWDIGFHMGWDDALDEALAILAEPSA
jgi:hypothetical protein